MRSRRTRMARYVGHHAVAQNNAEARSIPHLAVRVVEHRGVGGQGGEGGRDGEGRAVRLELRAQVVDLSEASEVGVARRTSGACAEWSVCGAERSGAER